MIAAIRDYFAEKGQTQRAQDITQEYLSKRDIRKQEETAYLHLIPEDRDFFLSRVVLPPGNPKRSVAPISHSQERIASAIENAAAFITSIAGTTQSPDDALLDLLEFIEKQSLLISVKVGDESNAFVIFEVLNDRGLDLSIADLIKNYVFRLAGDRLSEASASWAKMITAITEVAGEPDVKAFVRQAWIANNGLTREKQLYDVLKNQVTDKAKAVEYAKVLAAQAVTYAALGNPSHDRWKDYDDPVTEALEVFDMVGVTQIRPLLMAVFDWFDASEVNKAIPMMVAWTVRFLICGSGGSGTLESYYAERARDVSSASIKTAKELYEAMRSVLPNGSLARNSLRRLYQRTLSRNFICACWSDK